MYTEDGWIADRSFEIGQGSGVGRDPAVRALRPKIGFHLPSTSKPANKPR